MAGHIWRCDGAARPAWILTCVVLIVAFLRLLLLQGGIGSGVLYRLTPTRIDAIAVGALAAVIMEDGQVSNKVVAVLSKSPVGPLVFAALCALFFLTDLNQTWLYLGGFTAIALISALLILSVVYVRDPLSTLLGLPPVRWVGKRAYGLYLYHLPIFSAMETFRVPGSLKNFLWVRIASFTLTFLLAWLSYEYLELPCLRLKDRLQIARGRRLASR